MLDGPSEGWMFFKNTHHTRKESGGQGDDRGTRERGERGVSYTEHWPSSMVKSYGDARLRGLEISIYIRVLIDRNDEWMEFGVQMLCHQPGDIIVHKSSFGHKPCWTQ